MHSLILFSFWLIFWQKFLRNPYLLSTSEIASTYFPFWISMGRKWKLKDDIYFKYPGCIPFLSMWYWPNVLVSKLTKYISLNVAFKLYAYFILGHYFIASLVAYKLLGLFGAITLTYAAYCIKPQTPAAVFTLTWMPAMFLPFPYSVLGVYLSLSGGYWPILVYVLPIVALIAPEALLIGLVLASPQLIAFMWYWKRSVRSGQAVDREFGRLPLWKLKDLFWPTNSVSLTKGVHYPEVEMYMGIAPLFIFSFSWWWLPLIVSLLISVGILPGIQRIPSRALYLLTLCIAALSAQGLQQSHNGYIPLLLLHAFFLLKNCSIYPSFPFSQWWDKPSRLYQKFKNPGVWPHVTGYLQGARISTYRGAFALKHGG